MYEYQEFSRNPLHGVSIGDKFPDYVNAVIEIPKGSHVKYKLDEESGLIKLDRVLYSAVHYPANYGYIPRTIGLDKDPIDILVLCSVDVYPLTIIQARILGVMRMIDQGLLDDKIIAVAAKDVSFSNTFTLEDLPPYQVDQIKRFFEDYKKLEKKEVKINEFELREVAFQIIRDGSILYNETYPENKIIEKK